MIYQHTMNTPIGELFIQASQRGLTYVGFKPIHLHSEQHNTHTQKALQQLKEYFSGTRYEFDVEVDVYGTAFQKSVWEVLMMVPYGDTNTYSWMANRLNNPKAVRAVGSANGKNPISIIVPCHRIIGANGTLTGYAGGVEKKAWLLEHEQQNRKT
ncbi:MULTISPECIES: methylated-DNA--[protein]-cysteine S-methyltransferase [Pseudoalteromonas]|uniref:Methylated-DNA--protein-cysteine methyltransferase n=1 Tax=Pseudoalteromonas amylolytica TaxID=1859457 RepID=A0A1S1MZ86_9GAMM|nr:MULTISPECIES: methylated-DNA--[protein]-cysteine S-methyltransferase [Pseudoalteromonas]OHU85314.1 cysteine methyltransferase [Pseudoalteromonas sp. JW3]OHU93064.1 cysteine methyltransferase [Pseudoalteromonas amylolytica]